MEEDFKQKYIVSSLSILIEVLGGVPKWIGWDKRQYREKVDKYNCVKQAKLLHDLCWIIPGPSFFDLGIKSS